MKKHYTSFLISFLFVLSFGSYAQITTVPAVTGNNVSICQNGSVVFSSTDTPPAGATISWTFPGGTPSSASTIGPHPVYYTTPGTYTATLTINGSSSTVDVVVAPNSTVPSVAATQTFQQTGYGLAGDTLFYCGPLAGPYNGASVPFQFDITTYPPDHQVLVNWGDGLSDEYTGDIAEITHSYNCTSENIFNMSVSVTGPGGCVSAAVFVIYSGITPQISVSGNSGSHCMPAPYSFMFDANHIPGTTYEYDFLPVHPNYPPGAPDGPFDILPPFPVKVDHIFYENSCDLNSTVNGITYPNSYAGNIVGTNVCGQTFLSIGPIYVSNAPVAELLVQPTNGYACVEQPVTITNASTPGLIVNAAGCNPLNKWCYTITPSTGWELNNGSMGDCSNPNWVLWPDASFELDVTFYEYGTYYIELIQANGCGSHSVLDSICIVAPIEANFTADVISGCTPLEINTTNLPYVPSCIDNDAVYIWDVTAQAAANCPVGTAPPSFLNGTDANSQEPTFLFNNPGIYDIQLTSTLTNPIPNTLCDNDVQTVTVNVLQGPNITFNSYEVCEGDPINLTNTVQECYSQPTYAWTLPGASTPTSSDAVPNVTYSTAGTYPVDVVITNECGTGTFSSDIIVHPTVTVEIFGDNAACVNSVVNLDANIVGPATSGTWSVSPNVAGLVPSGTNATFTPPLNYTGTLTFSFVTTNAPAVCGQVTATHVLVYDADATANAGADLMVCQNGTVNLNGVIGGSASSLTWSSDTPGSVFSDVNSGTSTFTPPANFLGDITVTLTTDDPPGICELDTDELTISVMAPPTLSIDALNEVCQGGTLDVSAVVGGTQNGVTWTSPNGVFTPTTGLNPTFTASPVTFFGTTQIIGTTTGSAPCPAASDTISITVTPVPTVAFSIADQTICSGDDSEGVTLTSTTPNVAISWTTTVPAGVTGFGATGSNLTGGTTIPVYNNVVNTTNPPASVDVVFSAQAIAPGGGNCPTITTEHTITIIPNSIINPVSNVLVCNGEDVAPIVFVGTGTDYSWEITSSPIPIGLDNDTALTTPLFTATNPSNSPVTANVAVTSIFSGNNLNCPGLTTNFSITVNPSGQVNSLSDTTVCNNSNIASIPFSTNNTGGVTTYDWNNIGNSISIGGPGVNVSSIPTFTASQNTSGLSTAEIVVTPTFNNADLFCVGSADTFQIHVIPSPTITPVSEQVYCNGTTTSPVNFTGAATNFNWSYLPPPNIGLNPTSGSGPIPSFTATNTEATPVTVNFSATPIYEANTVTCFGVPESFDFTVNTTPLVEQVPDIIVCNGQPVVETAFSGNAEAYAWTITGANVGITGNGTGNLPSFTSQTGTATVCVVPQYTSAGLICYGDTMCFQIIVNPTPVVNPISNITICSESLQPDIVFTGTGSSYDWNVISGAPVTGVGLPFGTGPIASFTTVPTDIEVSDQINVTPIFTGNGLSCPGSSTSFGILVLRKPVVDQLPDFEICNADCNDPIPFIGTGSGYSWFVDNTFIGVASSGQGMEFESFCAINTDPLLVSDSGIITYYPTYTENNVTCLGDSLEFTITVNPTPSVNNIDDIILCDGTNSTPIAITGNATSYSWQIDNASVGTGFPTDGLNIIPPIIGFNPENDTTNNAQITIIPEFIGSGLDCAGVPFTFNIVVNPIPVIEPILDQTLCFNSLSEEVVFEGTGTSYNWELNGGVPSTIGIIGISGTDTLQVFTATNTTNLPISNIIEVTPVYTTDTVACFGTPTDFEIFVLPNPVIDAIDSASICNEEPTIPVNYSGTYTSNTWFISANPLLGINALLNGVDDLPSFTWLNTDNANPQSAVVHAAPFYTFNGLTCAGDTTIHVIDVLPTTEVTPLPDLVFCNSDVSAEFPIDATGTDISWNSSTNVGLTGGSTYFIPEFTATNLDVSPNAPSVVSTVNIIPSYTDNLGLTCVGTPSDFTITVHPTPVITPISNYTVCNFGTVFQELETNVASNISWSASTNAFITGETNAIVNSDIINEGLTNISPSPGTPQQTTYSVTAVSSPQGCSADTMSFVVNLMPTVTMSSSDFMQICNGNQVGLVLSANVASDYEWFGTGVSIGISNFGQTTPVINDVLFNSTGGNDINTYIVTPTSIDGSCPGVAQTIQVIVTPPPALISPSAASICSGQVVNYQFVANTSSTFTWFGQGNANVDGVTQSVIQNPFITDTLFNTTSGPEVVTYNVVITAIGSGNCSSEQIPVYITVQPLPVVVPEIKEICPDETVTFSLQASEPSSFSWFADNNLFVSGESTLPPTNSNFISNTLTQSTYDPQSVFYNVTPTSLTTGCVGLTIQHTAIVNPLPDLSFTTSDVLCTENPVTFTISATTPLNALWDFGNFQQSNLLSDTTFYDEPGEYVVTLFGINPQTGCEDLVFETIPILEAPPVDFITSSTQECVPAFFQFTDTADNPGSILSWDFGDGTTSNEQGIADHYYEEAGCFDVTLTATAPNGCPNTITYEEMVCAYNIPIAGFIVNDPIQFGDVNEFIFENVTVFGHTYSWDFGDDSPTTNAVHPGHIYPIDRNIYNVVLVATNEAGCSDTAMVSIQVQERLIFYVPNTFTPDGNTRNETFQPVFTSGYDIYSYELMIFNRWGETMFESYNDKVGWDGTYGGEVMEDGTYVYRIRFKLLDDDDFQEYYGHVNLLK